jgi:O-antigen/teichoic acid export membrane protein
MLKKNIVANFGSQFYATAAALIAVPLYFKFMGAESYGLIGFFSMLQVFFNLLDMGITPTMARESARYNGGAISATAYRQLARALEGIFCIVALVGCFLFFILADPIAVHWLKASSIPINEVIGSLQLIAFIIALRWMGGLYRGVISGAERLVWLSIFNSIVTTFRFLLVLPLLIFISASTDTFFKYQLGVALVEFVILIYMAYKILPSVPKGTLAKWELAPLRPVLKFSLSIAFTSSVWVLITQIDKLLLSKILPLEEYAYFTVAVMLASGIMLVTGPISIAIMPRMTRLQAETKTDELLLIYRQTTRLVTILITPVTLMLVIFSAEVLWVWTGDRSIVDNSSDVLMLYSIGYAFLAVGAFPYYLQYAKGDLHLHLVGNAIFALLIIPSVIWLAINFGMRGAGWAWLLSNITYFLFWVPLVHYRFANGLHWDWLLKDIIKPFLCPAVVCYIISRLVSLSDSRLFLFAELFIFSLFLLLVSYLSANRLKI